MAEGPWLLMSSNKKQTNGLHQLLISFWKGRSTWAPLASHPILKKRRNTWNSLASHSLFRREKDMDPISFSFPAEKQRRAQIPLASHSRLKRKRRTWTPLPSQSLLKQKRNTWTPLDSHSLLIRKPEHGTHLLLILQKPDKFASSTQALSGLSSSPRELIYVDELRGMLSHVLRVVPKGNAARSDAKIPGPDIVF